MFLKEFDKARERKLFLERSSEEEHTTNALASGAEEGRDKLRKATDRSKYPSTPGFPNGETR